MSSTPTPEARRRWTLWAERYDRRYGSEHSPLTYTLRAQLAIEVAAALDLVVVEVDVMQHEFYGASGWQRALFLDRDGDPFDLPTCDLHRDPEGWTIHCDGNGDLVRITAAGIVSSPAGQVLLAPALKRFDRTGRKLWASRPVRGSLPNRARDAELFELARPLPRTPDRTGICAHGDMLVLETDREVAVIDARTGKRVGAQRERRPLMAAGQARCR